MNTAHKQETDPRTLEYLYDRAITLCHNGETRLSLRGLIEYVRETYGISVNNNDTVSLRKQLIAKNPDLAGYFETRKLSKSKHKKSINYDFLQFIESLDCEVTQVTLRNDKGASYTLSKDQALRIKNKKVK